MKYVTTTRLVAVAVQTNENNKSGRTWEFIQSNTSGEKQLIENGGHPTASTNVTNCHAVYNTCNQLKQHAHIHTYLKTLTCGGRLNGDVMQ